MTRNVRTVNLSAPTAQAPAATHTPFPYTGGLSAYVVEGAEGFFAEAGSIDRFGLCLVEQAVARIPLNGLMGDEALDLIDGYLPELFACYGCLDH